MNTTLKLKNATLGLATKTRRLSLGNGELSLGLTQLSLSPQTDELAPQEGETTEAYTKRVLTATENAFKQRAQAEQKRFETATDSEYWFCVCFQTREQKDAFLREFELEADGDKYLDGQLVAEKLKVKLPPADVPYNTSTKQDAKLAALTKPARKTFEIRYGGGRGGGKSEMLKRKRDVR